MVPSQASKRGELRLEVFEDSVLQVHQRLLVGQHVALLGGHGAQGGCEEQACCYGHSETWLEL